MSLFRPEVQQAQSAQLRQAVDEIILLERRVALSQTSVQRYQQLAAEGFMSNIQVQGKLEDQLDDTDTATPSAEAKLYAPSRTAGFAHAGQSVYLRYPAYPYQKVGLHTGRITSVPDTPFAANELPPNLAPQRMAQAGSTEALDKQSISSHGQSYGLKAGRSPEADVLQERRKAWEWVLEPLLAARAQLKVLGAEPKAASPGR